MFKVQVFLLGDGCMHVHQAGCADIAKKRLPQRSDSHGQVESYNDLDELVYDTYADIAAENDVPDTVQAVASEYASEFKFYPCVKAIPVR